MSKADDIFWRQFGSILAALILFGIVCFFIARVIAGVAHVEQVNSPSAIAARIAPAATVRVGDPSQVVAAAAPAQQQAAAPAAADSGAGEGETVYSGVCAGCHISGAANAPKLDDQAAWAPRLELGTDALVSSVVNGKGAMPAKGGNPSLSEEQIRAAVEYMIAQVEGGDAEPASAGGSGEPESAPGGSDESAASLVEQAVQKAADATAAAADATASAASAARASASTAAATAAEKVMQATGMAQQASEQVAAAAPSGETAAAGKPGPEVYNMGCVACHATGAANAPKLDDTAAWESRLANGVDPLVQSVLNGKGAMPPKGGFATLTEDDIRNAVNYMLEQAGVAGGG